MKNQKKRKWTVFFIVKSTDNSIKQAVKMVSQLMNIRYPDDIAVVLCLNINEHNLQAILFQDVDLIVHPDPAPVFTTMFYKITTIKDEFKVKYNVLEFIDENRDFDLTERECLEVYFRRVIVDKYAAKKYLLFTWDHGTGFGIFRRTVNESFDKYNVKQSGYLEYVKPKSDTDILSIDELGQAITWAMKKKIDLVVMMNCNMQTFDTVYALRNSAKHLVAPESVISYSGYNYPAIFRRLAGDPDISAAKLAAWVIKSFGEEPYGPATRADLDISLFATRLKHCDRMVSALDKLGGLLLARLNDDYDKIRVAFNQAPTVRESPRLIDLYVFLMNLDAIATPVEQMWIQYLFLLKNDIITDNHIGPTFSEPGYENNGFSVLTPIPGPPPGFLDPEKKAGHHYTAFLRESVWGKLIARIIELEGPAE